MDAYFYEVKPGYERNALVKRKWIRFINFFVCVGDYITNDFAHRWVLHTFDFISKLTYPQWSAVYQVCLNVTDAHFKNFT